MVEPGVPSRPPKGFMRSLHIGGRRVRIKYFRTIRDGKGRLSGICQYSLGEIWVSTFKVCRQAVADTLWHEAKHWMLNYQCQQDGSPCNQAKPLMPQKVEESVILAFEDCDAGVMRNNRWFWKLYGE